MASSFSQRIQELSEQVGHGKLTGRVVVDQIYAQYQHEGLDLRHPRGGQAKYLEQPLLDHREEYLRKVSETVLDDGGKGGMVRSMEDLAGSGGVAVYAPILFGLLRRSGHPMVESDGKTVYDRPPEQPRATEEELRLLAHTLALPPRLLGWTWWHVEHHTEPPLRRSV
jgi:hypothetical protein